MNAASAMNDRLESEIEELYQWLNRLLRQKNAADPVTLGNVHRRLSKLHADAAARATGQVGSDVAGSAVPTDDAV